MSIAKIPVSRASNCIEECLFEKHTLERLVLSFVSDLGCNTEATNIKGRRCEIMKTPTINLSGEDALVLQIISESGEEDIVSLERSLGISRGRVLASLESLRRKGLITVRRISGDWWVRISTKGKQLTHYVWPELAMSRTP